MNLWLKKNWRNKPVTIIGLLGGMFLLIIILISLLILDFPYAIKTASASTHLGILGQRAPELNLNDWIDADGKKMAPIRLTEYRGKVIYLYFFQDW
jgi:hypothetical protein